MVLIQQQFIVQLKILSKYSLNKVNQKKIRLDALMVQNNFASSRERAKRIIMTGNVFVDDAVIDKPGTLIDFDAKIVCKEKDIPFVSRGGLKLEKAIKELSIDVTGLNCLDIGASTGGFTDCLLQHGANKIYAVDVGYGQFDWNLRNNPKVIVIERTNIRYLPYERIGEKLDLIVIDTSFISLKIVIPSAEKFMKENTRILALIKPQFEAGKGKVGKGGVVRDEKVRNEVINDIQSFFVKRGYKSENIVSSPILGPKGNKEYIISLKYFHLNA
ncbi:MAG: TlyA family RNA methyltransferase [Desulfobacterales bacterium]|nr:TlyA family RNA methyltransferase [Desulfobacterales bacterium]